MKPFQYMTIDYKDLTIPEVTHGIVWAENKEEVENILPLYREFILLQELCSQQLDMIQKEKNCYWAPPEEIKLCQS